MFPKRAIISFYISSDYIHFVIFFLFSTSRLNRPLSWLHQLMPGENKSISPENQPIKRHQWFHPIPFHLPSPPNTYHPLLLWLSKSFIGVICFMNVNLMTNIYGCDLHWNISNSTFRLLLIKLMIKYTPLCKVKAKLLSIAYPRG